MQPNSMYLKLDNSSQFLLITQELYEKAIDSKSGHLYSAPFVLFCATTLEYMLNNIMINYVNTHFGTNAPQTYAMSFINLSVGAKLITCLPIITGNKHQLNLNSFEYKTLRQIINKRNKIAHG